MILNTKNDYLNLLSVNPEYGKSELKTLLDNRFEWFSVAVIENKDSVLVDDTHRIIGYDELIYQEYLEDSNAKLFRIGFNVDEVEELLNE